VEYEIIFVNDGSPDDSAQVIREVSAGDPRVIGISHSRNFGSQMAFRSGMEIATKDAVVLLDGDLQDPPELIESFYARWEEGFDVVYGRRVKRDMPWHWGLLYKLFYRVFAMFSYVSIPLDAGDFSLIDRRVVGWLLNARTRSLRADARVRRLQADGRRLRATGTHVRRDHNSLRTSTGRRKASSPSATRRSRSHQHWHSDAHAFRAGGAHRRPTPNSSRTCAA
jgi:glycosyltransferase involved in cell wall biosynthesis